MKGFNTFQSPIIIMASRWLPREFAYDTRGFRKSLRLYAAGVIVLGGIGLLLLRISERLLLPAVLILVGAVALFALMLAGPLPPVATKHQVTSAAAVLRQGWFFALTIPFKKIASIRVVGELPGKTGVRLSRRDATLQVLSSGRGVVRIDLTEPITVRRVKVDRVLLDAEDPEGFVACVRERMGEAPGVAGPDSLEVSRPPGPREPLGGEGPVARRVRLSKRASGGDIGSREAPGPVVSGSARELPVALDTGRREGLDANRAGAAADRTPSADAGAAETGDEEVQEIVVEPAWMGEGTQVETRVIKVRGPKRSRRAREGEREFRERA